MARRNTSEFQADVQQTGMPADRDSYSTVSTKTLNAAVKNIAVYPMICISSKIYNAAAANIEITKNAKGHIQAFALQASAALPF